MYKSAPSNASIKFAYRISRYQKNPEFRSELAENGGRVKVPCLRIEENGEVQWMYESNDIIAYLQQRFG
ncbi:glutathione S-transferase N-terminal domain-containing protein [Psychrobacter sp. DAB_AL43B]|uniref:glutathione S-transferase N-terminal domain-containing protein n=1 Tax=Psychrobacter sp. DAB_AL43B TaxID=1028416 RepID=UPI0009C3DA6D|nr:glutathione S-transferase N-terminal domain-containing protein [Psychrobacter sp. DAB_AL43B]SLJ83579.1 hypothetical protein DABAL43B_0364 [Psychrobacter sp. DAB_AL43B]